jgi:hypothetical protein
MRRNYYCGSAECESIKCDQISVINFYSINNVLINNYDVYQPDNKIEFIVNFSELSPPNSPTVTLKSESMTID